MYLAVGMTHDLTMRGHFSADDIGPFVEHALSGQFAFPALFTDEVAHMVGDRRGILFACGFGPSGWAPATCPC